MPREHQPIVVSLMTRVEQCSGRELTVAVWLRDKPDVTDAFCVLTQISLDNVRLEKLINKVMDRKTWVLDLNF